MRQHDSLLPPDPNVLDMWTSRSPGHREDRRAWMRSARTVLRRQDCPGERIRATQEQCRRNPRTRRANSGTPDEVKERCNPGNSGHLRMRPQSASETIKRIEYFRNHPKYGVVHSLPGQAP